MKKLITITILVVAMFLLSANTSYGWSPKLIENTNTNTNSNTNSNMNSNMNSNKNMNSNMNSNTNSNKNCNTNNVDQDQRQGQMQGQRQGQLQGQLQGQFQGQGQINEGNTTEIDMETNIVNPAPIINPGFISPNYKTPMDESWTSNPFELNKSCFTVKELTRFANPSQALGIFWYEWNKSFQIEMACWTKAKPQKTIRIYTHAIKVNGYVKIGEAHARAVELHKSENQVAAALCVFAAKQGAKIVVIRTFSNPVTKADSAVLGGAGASVTGYGNVINSAGGFGWATAEKVFRSYVTAELYR